MHFLVNSTTMCSDPQRGSLDSKGWYFCYFFFFLQLETSWKKQIVAGLHPMSEERLVPLSLQNCIQENAVVKILFEE